MIGEGGSGTVSVSATSDGGAIAYQWFNATRSTNIAGANAAELDFGPISLAADATQYNVSLTNTGGTTTSATRTLTVNERVWSTPADALASAARQVATVVDSNGHTHLLAITGNNLAAAVQASIQLRSSSPTQANAFTAPGNAVLQASEALGAGGTSIAAAANSNGRVLAVWHRNGIVGGALYTPGINATTAGSWALLPTRINSFQSTSALEPAVAAVGSDAFEIVWRERIANTGAHDVMARRYNVGNNTLDSSVPLEALSSETEAPRVVAEPGKCSRLGTGVGRWSTTGRRQGRRADRASAQRRWDERTEGGGSNRGSVRDAWTGGERCGGARSYGWGGWSKHDAVWVCAGVAGSRVAGSERLWTARADQRQEHSPPAGVTAAGSG